MGIGEILASFQGVGKDPRFKELLKREQRGSEISLASSLRTRLFKPFGPEALPSAKDFKTDSTSSGVKTSLAKRVVTAYGVISGSAACCSLRIVCSQKKVLRRLALSCSSVYNLPL